MNSQPLMCSLRIDAVQPWPTPAPFSRQAARNSSPARLCRAGPGGGSGIAPASADPYCVACVACALIALIAASMSPPWAIVGSWAEIAESTSAVKMP